MHAVLAGRQLLFSVQCVHRIKLSVQAEERQQFFLLEKLRSVSDIYSVSLAHKESGEATRPRSPH